MYVRMYVCLFVCLLVFVFVCIYMCVLSSTHCLSSTERHSSEVKIGLMLRFGLLCAITADPNISRRAADTREKAQFRNIDNLFRQLDAHFPPFVPPLGTPTATSTTHALPHIQCILTRVHSNCIRAAHSSFGTSISATATLSAAPSNPATSAATFVPCVLLSVQCGCVNNCDCVVLAIKRKASDLTDDQVTNAKRAPR